MTVELYDPNRTYAAPAGAHLVYGGGPLLSDVKLVGCFVRAQDGTSHPLKSFLSGFLDWYGSSDLLGELAEYDRAGNVLTSGSHIADAELDLPGSTPPPPPPPPSGGVMQCIQDCLTQYGYTSVRERLAAASNKHIASGASVTLQDADVQKMISSAISAGVVPAADANTLYVLFFPSGVTIQLGSDASCSTFCGYHDSFVGASGGVRYAVLPYPDCAGCTGGMSVEAALTSVTSHEIDEAVTDPEPGSGWYDQANGEIGDICAWQTKNDGPYTAQLEWSNSHDACI